MSQSVDEAEHSGEMQLPYIHRLLQLAYPNQPESAYPPRLPNMIGSTSPSTESALGHFLAPYIAEPSNLFIISSDFCHWGSRFGYTYYLPSAPSPALNPTALPNGVHRPNQPADTTLHHLPTLSQGITLHSSKSVPQSGPPIHASIAHADRACMCAIASGSHAEFLTALQDTGNTICGRHPIGVFMAGVEEVERLAKEKGEELEEGRARFRFTRYERSSDVMGAGDSSVSYVSAFAVL
jgi:AmmeMemoRadiSam system protein B